MAPWDELIVQGLVSAGLYAIAVILLRDAFRRALRIAWAEWAIHALVFLSILGAFAFLQLPGWTLLGATFSVIAVSALTLVIQEKASAERQIPEWLGPDAPALLHGLPKDPANNARVLRRTASMLRGRAGTTTENIQTSVEFQGMDSEKRFFLYDVTDVTTYALKETRDVELVIEVNPDLLGQGHGNQDLRPLPLSFRDSQGKWRCEFGPLVRQEDLPSWEKILDAISIEGWTGHPVRRERARIEFKREKVEFATFFGTERVVTSSLRFSGSIRLGPDAPMITTRVKGLSQTVDVPSLYFFAWDICANAWKFRVDAGRAPDVEIAHLEPITTSEDVTILSWQVAKGHGEITFQAAPGSAILPQDAALLHLRLLSAGREVKR